MPAVLKIVYAEQPPLCIFVGTEGMQVVRAAFAERLALWEAWADTSNAAQGPLGIWPSISCDGFRRRGGLAGPATR